MATRTVPNGKKPSARQPVKAQRVRFRYHRPNKWNTRFPINRLPFAVRLPEGGMNRWAFPAVDGYGPGCDLGSAAAMAYLKALRLKPDEGGGCLQTLVLDAIAAGATRDGQRGIVVGFFSALDHWLGASVRLLGSSLDELSETELEQRMERAVNLSARQHHAALVAKAKELGLEVDE